LLRERVESFERYPFSIPSIRGLETLELDPKVTFFVGENGSGKSTILEGIAIAAGFDAEGGTNFRFSTRASESPLGRCLRLSRGRTLHEQSHGESFLALVEHRFGPNGLYLLDEPEAALSPSRSPATS
jgi:predicted ATPase